MLLDIANNYKTLVQFLPDLIDVSGYRNDYLSKKMGLAPATFSAKKQRGNWSTDDVAKLMAIIENEDVEDYLMLQLMRAAKNDETISADEFRKENKEMEVIIAKSFLKDLKMKPKAVAQAVEKLISLLEASSSLDKSGVDFKKMEGQKKGENYYRIRLGAWRIGIEYIHPKIIVLRILARGAVYKYFPPQ